MLDRDLLPGGDGGFDRRTAEHDRLSAPGSDVDYRVTPRGVAQLGAFGIDFEALTSAKRPLVRYCVDWASSATTWPARWAPRSLSGCSSSAGSAARHAQPGSAGSDGSRRPGSRRPASNPTSLHSR